MTYFLNPERVLVRKVAYIDPDFQDPLVCCQRLHRLDLRPFKRRLPRLDLAVVRFQHSPTPPVPGIDGAVGRPPLSSLRMIDRDGPAGVDDEIQSPFQFVLGEPEVLPDEIDECVRLRIGQ